MDNEMARSWADARSSVLRQAEDQVREVDRLQATANPPPMPAPPAHASIRRRSHATPGSHYLHRLRHRRSEDDLILERLETVQDAVNRLNQASANLSTFLDEPLTQIRMDHETFDSTSGESYRRRHKRRKLDADTPGPEKCLRYGHFGQVVPGRLKMSIQSCDGGELDVDCGISSIGYPAENIIRNDLGVYCTERPKCNIILKHWEDTMFSLTKLVLKAPSHSFTAPVQEGLVFVSMTLEGLLARTAQYDVPVPVPPYLEPSLSQQRAYINRLPVGTTLRDYHDRRLPSRGTTTAPDDTLHTIVAEIVQRRRNVFPGAVYAPDSPSYFLPLNLEPRNFDSPFIPPHDSDHTTIQAPPPPPSTRRPASPPPPPPSDLRSDRIPTPPPFDTNLSCDPLSSDDEESSAPDIIRDRQQRLNNPHSPPDDEDPSNRRAQQLRSTPRNIEWRQNGDLERKTEPLRPHAQFFIEKGKHVVSIKFDPPVSARYILLKLWSPVEGNNIDIQSVLAYGYGGPRFFPARQFL